MKTIRDLSPKELAQIREKASVWGEGLILALKAKNTKAIVNNKTFISEKVKVLELKLGDTINVRRKWQKITEILPHPQAPNYRVLNLQDDSQVVMADHLIISRKI